MDVIGNFLKERCVQTPGVSVRIRELFKAYQEWCGENNEHAVSERFLGLRLKEMGFERTRTADARYWSALALKAQRFFACVRPPRAPGGLSVKT
jgi:putative DNA primase/helicase